MGAVGPALQMPAQELAAGSAELSLEKVSVQISDIATKALLFDSGTLFVSDHFRGPEAAFLIDFVRRTYSAPEIRKVPAAIITDFIRAKSGKFAVGMDALDNREVLREVGELCRTAGRAGSSDVHMFPDGDRQVVRFKTNGDLVPFEGYSKEFADQLMASIFVACDQKESGYLRKKYQQGRMLPEAIGGVPGYEAIRCQWNPDAQGRSLFLRMQKPLSTYKSLKGLNYKPKQLEMLRRALSTGKGGVLIAAPTNAGKTTTMGMMCLERLARRPQNGIAIEDPSEYILPMRQFSVNAGDDEDERRRMFAKAFQALNRSDPDMVLVGEIRGGEVGETVVKIAASHFLIGSFHADNTMEAFPQLARLGIDEGDVYNSLLFRYLIAQRLIQRLCDRCSVQIDPRDIDQSFDFQRIASLGVDMSKAKRKGLGCTHCKGTGVTGMFPIVEIIKTSRDYMKAVQDGDAPYVNALLKAKDVYSMADEGIMAIQEGIADPSYVMSALGEFEDTDVRFGVQHA